MSAYDHMSKASAKHVDPRSSLADAVEAHSVLDPKSYPGQPMDWEQRSRAYEKQDRAERMIIDPGSDTYCAGE